VRLRFFARRRFFPHDFRRWVAIPLCPPKIVRPHFLHFAIGMRTRLRALPRFFLRLGIDYSL
jgi:hypothetical protein